MSEAMNVSVAFDASVLSSMNIEQIARLIRKTWVDKNGKGNVNFAAKPYLDAMFGLDNVNDKYGYDDGKGIVNRFLGNASSYRGETAKAVKAELKKRIK